MLKGKGIRVQVINMYQLPDESSDGPMKHKSQCDRIHGKLKSDKVYREEALKDVSILMRKTKNIDEVILVGDVNKDVTSKKLKAFLTEYGLCDVFCECNNSEDNEREATYIREKINRCSISHIMIKRIHSSMRTFRVF